MGLYSTPYILQSNFIPHYSRGMGFITHPIYPLQLGYELYNAPYIPHYSRGMGFITHPTYPTTVGYILVYSAPSTSIYTLLK